MRKPLAPARTRLDDLSTGELIARGESLLSARNYRDAIDLYKLLLKREPQAEAGWRESLAAVYLERAKELAGKAMHREAAVLWENIPSLCGRSPQPELYVGWLLHSGQYAKAVRAYADHAAALADASELETLLAALALAGQKDVLQVLPQDAPTRRQLTVAQNALRAYSQGESEAVAREGLQHIPTRSPYRDLRQVLAALLKLETDPASAPALVDRIPASSPYRGLVEIVRACAVAEPLRALAALDPAAREIASGLIGLEPRQLKLLKEWTRLGETPSDAAIFGFITANLAALDRDQARRASLALLATHPAGLAIHVKLFGPLPPYQSHRLQALKAERDGDLRGILHHWRACADLLAEDAADPDGRLMAALILRHLACLLGEDPPPSWFVEARIEDLLEHSLTLDPDDRDTYLQLAKLHQDAGNDKEHHRWVERAVKQFPDDPQVLLAAVATATARKAYKKAAGFAARVLELDPINSKARNILIHSHLAHARKQLLAGKHELATRELDSAAQLERDNARSGVVEINRGLLAFTQRQRERARQWLREGVRIAGSPLLARLRLVVETSRLRLEPALFLRDLELNDPGKFAVGRADLLAMTRMLAAYREEGVEDLGSALEDLEKPLKRAIKALNAEDDLLSVCECLHQAPHHELLKFAATRALERHPERPLFVYFQIFGRAEGDLDQVKDRDYQRLEDAEERAVAAKDHRAKLLIRQFLDQDLFHAPRSRPGPGPGHPAEMNQLREDLERLPPGLRDQLLDEIMEELPIDADGLPPEARKVLLKALLLGGGDLADLLDAPDLPPPAPGRGRRRKRRS